MATQGYQEYQAHQGNYHSMQTYEHHSQWHHQQHFSPHENVPIQNYGYAHNGYGYGQGYYEAAMYPSYYPNNYNGYEMNIPHDSNSFLPSDCSDCIFISGLPKNIQKEDIINTFSTVGKIKVAKGTQRIFLFLDRKTKDPIGDATVTFTSAESAQKAIEVFNNTDFNGHGEITVQIAKPEQKNPFAEMLRRQSEANNFGMQGGCSYSRGFGSGLRGNISHNSHNRVIGRNGSYRNNRGHNLSRGRGGNRSSIRNTRNSGQRTPPDLNKEKVEESSEENRETESISDLIAKTLNITLEE